jgi:hypothetical protein
MSRSDCLLPGKVVLKRTLYLGEVVTVQWPVHVDADVIRARWVEAQWRFSPFNNWPPPLGEPAPLQFADREVGLAGVAVALVVVSSHPALWEVQAQIVDYCTQTETEPAPSWRTIAALNPTVDSWRTPEGIPRFLAGTHLAVPPLAVVAAARVMSGTFEPSTLDGLGYVVAGMAAHEGGADLEECLDACKEDAECLLRCLAQGLARG